MVSFFRVSICKFICISCHLCRLRWERAEGLFRALGNSAHTYISKERTLTENLHGVATLWQRRELNLSAILPFVFAASSQQVLYGFLICLVYFYRNRWAQWSRYNRILLVVTHAVVNVCCAALHSFSCFLTWLSVKIRHGIIPGMSDGILLRSRQLRVITPHIRRITYT
jgi:hypothetical protein